MGSVTPKTASGKLGETIPLNDIHGISVSLPTWESTVGWASRDPAVVDLMSTGYPRFFIHRLIDELTRRIVLRHQKEHNLPHDFNSPTRFGMAFPAAQYAESCERFLKRSAENQDENINTITVGLPSLKISECQSAKHVDWANLQLHIVIYPAHIFSLAKSFWQHTGFGISSRYAEFCLRNFDDLVVGPSLPQHASKSTKERHSGEKFVTSDLPSRREDENCKLVLRRRIRDLHPASSGIAMRDVFLFHTGMTAFTSVAQALLKREKEAPCKVVCYGFLYVDTFKVMEKVFQIHTILHGHASSAELDTLSSFLQAGNYINAIVIEVPQNPLLGSPDLLRIKKLANTYNFLIIVDDTVGTTVNIDTLAFADIIITSLSKMFSGACNVMGGSVVVNPRSSHAAEMRRLLTVSYIDTYFPPDAQIMESNSRTFASRVRIASKNAALVAACLRSHPCVQTVYYPKNSPTQIFYDEFMRPEGGYSYLLSVTFRRREQAVAFFDNLDVAKGPSLGTNFTLACPYTLFAHYKELEWAGSYGVEEFLVRISVGLEGEEVLRDVVEKALDIAGRI